MYTRPVSRVTLIPVEVQEYESVVDNKLVSAYMRMGCGFVNER